MFGSYNLQGLDSFQRKVIVVSGVCKFKVDWNKLEMYFCFLFIGIVSEGQGFLILCFIIQSVISVRKI